MKYVMTPRRVTLLIYEDENSDKYSAACQININGTYATIDTLIGSGFYKFLAEYGSKPFRDLGIKYISAIVTEAHAKVMKKLIGAIPDVEVSEIGPPEESVGGVMLCYITFKLKSPQDKKS